MPEVKSKSRVSKKPGPDAPAGITPDTYEAIRARAYELYLERGGEHGRDVEDWARAEAEIIRSLT